MRMFRWLCTLILLAGFGIVHAAAELAAVPPLTNRVVDLGATLSAEQRAALENRLREFEQRKGSQIAILIVPNTRPEAIEQYAIRVAEQWKIGRKKADDGALLVVARNDRAVRIEVGYGLEGALNDATVKRIIDNIIVPRFRQNDYDGGISAGVDGMIKVIDGEPLPAVAGSSPAGDIPDVGQLLPVVLVAAVALGGVLRSMFGRMGGAIATGGLIGLAAWFIAGLLASAILAGVVGFLFSLLGGGHGGLGGVVLGHGHGRRGGGFGGFRGGGGGFGGGGASGRW
ncbi:MAG TPA: hypothetical protein DHV59_15805 [Oxalobacteraceae bacterium]|nr:hypothetical protein [Oxalobacteraceae bacterium]